MNSLSHKIRWTKNPYLSENFDNCKALFAPEIIRRARNFHRQIPGFKMSPLCSLPNLSKMLGVGSIWVKDESVRLQLNSFKVLGGSFAVYKYIKKQLGRNDDSISYDELISEETLKKLGKITFATATDGNHGRGIAWAAQKMGHDCMVYVHEDTSKPRIEAIRSYGATVKIIKGNYDDAVRQIAIDAEENNWVVLSDTSWEGYTDVPTWIIQGYATMMAEIQEQFSGQGITKPTHVFIQAGVGALAASVIGYYHALFGVDAPKCIVVEPENASCLYQSIVVGEGKPKSIKGDLDTIMAGLACGDPSPIAWDILKGTTRSFISCPDFIAAKGMRIYATPLSGDPFIVSGESGAVTLGTLVSILSEPGLFELRDFLEIDENSEILLINTEGNTDPLNFRQIIWEGSNPVPKEYWTNF